MKKDPMIFLTHILHSINAIERYLQDVTEKQFENSEEKQDLAVRRLEIIGEATKNISMEFREQHPEIPWKRMAGMRDVVIHQYYNVDYSVIWDTVTNLLPSLKKQIENLLS